MVIAMLDSVHSYRWLQQFENEEITFFLFPSSPMRKIHPGILKLAADNGRGAADFRILPLAQIIAIPLWFADKFLDNRIRSYLVRRWRRLNSIEVVHALELQNAGYILLRAFQRYEACDKPRLMVTNWGSDIFWFQEFPRHKRKLANLMRLVDDYACECERDVELARRLGFMGQVMPVIPNSGGFPPSVFLATPGNHRAVIAVKGYQGWVGRAVLALEAIEQISDEIRPFHVVVYSANWVTIRKARQVRKRTGLRITIFRKGALTHDEMLSLFSESLIYVGVSLSDGISTSLLEAMAMGAIPVQTSTACCDEWFDGSGVKVPDFAKSTIASAILQGLKLAKNPSNAEENRKIILARASEGAVRPQALEFYR